MPARLSKAQLDHLHSFRPQLQKVEDATGVPWQAVAALWYRESDASLTPPKTEGGPFQFDPVPSAARISSLLNHFSHLPKEIIAEYVKKGINDFEAAAMTAACHGRAHCKPVIKVNSSDTDIMDFFWGYNGKAAYHQGNPKNSFYVYNGYDVQHDGLLIIGSIPDEKSPTGRRKIRRKETRPGAFVVYRQLRGQL